MSLEIELAKLRAVIAWDPDLEEFLVQPDNPVAMFGITQIDGVPIKVDQDTLFEFRD